MKQYILEPSRGSHVLHADDINIIKEDKSTITVETKGNAMVKHGEHHTIAIESPRHIKFVQQEYNPVTKALQNAFD